MSAKARRTGDESVRLQARDRVETAKQLLGERGPAWWQDGAPDYNRRMARNTPYAEWFASLDRAERTGSQYQSSCADR